MSHHHHHHEVNGSRLFLTVLLNIVIVISQVIGALFSGSLALLSDALHNFSDVLALLITWWTNRLASKPQDTLSTFGYKRAEILATLFNASALVAIALFLIIEAVKKMIHPEPIVSTWVIGLGLLSVILNTLSLLLIKSDASKSINVKAAYLHLLTDVMTSVAVVIGGVLIYYFNIYLVDSIISILIALYLIKASYDLIKESGSILMQFTPNGMDLESIAKEIEKEEELSNAHHLHLWRLNDKEVFLEAHLDFKEDLTLSKSEKVIDKLEHKLYDKFGINHCTFQCEYSRDDNKSRVINE